MNHELWIAEKEGTIIDKETGIKYLIEELTDRYILQIWKPKGEKPFINKAFYKKDYDYMMSFVKGAVNSQKRRLEYREEKKKNKTLSCHVKCAKEIRQELKKTFPNTKFKVTSQTYSMGNSVDISWENAETSEEIDNITFKYQYGHFNGMEDMYEASNLRNDISQVKYVKCNRTITNNKL